MIAVDLSRQSELDADPWAIQQINFTANLDAAKNTTMFFITEEAKETVFEFSKGTVKVLWMELRFQFFKYIKWDSAIVYTQCYQIPNWIN